MPTNVDFDAVLDLLDSAIRMLDAQKTVTDQLLVVVELQNKRLDALEGLLRMRLQLLTRTEPTCH